MKQTSMKSISKIFMVGLILAGLSFSVQAQDVKKKQSRKMKAKTEQTTLKEHVCTQACHDTGKHVYAHGEKGHVCTDACKKPM